MDILDCVYLLIVIFVLCYGRKCDEFGVSFRDDVELVSNGVNEVCWGRIGWLKIRYRWYFIIDYEYYGLVVGWSVSEVSWNRICCKFCVYLVRLIDVL